MKAVVAAFNQEKVLVGAFFAITNLQMDLYQALLVTCRGEVVGGVHVCADVLVVADVVLQQLGQHCSASLATASRWRRWSPAG